MFAHLPRGRSAAATLCGALTSLRCRLALVVFAVSLPAQAQDSAANSYQDNRLDALHYRTPAAVYTGSASATTHTPDTEQTRVNGTKTNSQTKQYFAVGASVSYGVDDSTEVELAESYLLGRKTTTTATGTGVQTSSSSFGPSDPTISVNYRYLGGLSGSRFGSVFLSIAPAVGTAASAGGGQSGNNLNGSTALGLGTSFFWVCDPGEVQARAEVFDYSSGSSTPHGSSTPVTTKNYATYDLAVYYRQHLGGGSFVEPGLVVDGPYGVSSTNPNHNPTTQAASKYPARAVPSIDLGWLATPKIVLDLFYSYAAYTETVNATSGPTRDAYSYPLTQGVLRFSALFVLGG